jgi:mRNA interferase RelE/StbE
VSTAPNQPEPRPYAIEFKPQARKQLRKLPAAQRQRIMDKINELALNPRPEGCLKLAGEENLWRIRVGDYRVVYSIHDAELRVLVVRAAHRKDVYD